MTEGKGKYLIVIAGPTAVGKTSIALKAAKYLGAEIFSCDSRQIYREMSIGTAKPSPKELAAVPHYFIDYCSIEDRYTAGLYESDAEAALAEYFTKKDVAILTGGTGLYIDALLHGLDRFPEVPPSIQKALEMDLGAKGVDALAARLADIDPPTAAKLDLKNPRRVLRALGVCLAEGRPYSSYVRQEKKKLDFTPVFIALTRDRELLYERINNRVDLMMEAGLLEEATDLYERRHLRALQTVGYQELFEYLDGKVTLEEAVELIKRNSRRYAKRQVTWFKNRGTYEHLSAEGLDRIYTYISMAMTSQ